MDKLKNDVWKANISLWKNNLVCGTQGNVSGLDKGSRQFYIKPSGVAYEELEKDMLVGVDMDGNVTCGSLMPSVDTVHHIYLYKNLEGIGGVCHTHSRFITVFSVLRLAVPVFTTAQADVFGAEIPVSNYVDNTGEKIGEKLVALYEETGCNAIILGNHGLFTVGPTAEKAAFYALMAEYCAEVGYYAINTGRLMGLDARSLGQEEVKKWFDRYHSERYGQLER